LMGLEKIFINMGMDKDGFLPAQDCDVCNKPLQGQGSGHPAELYAGTFTGLCYDCERAPAFLVRVYPCGASEWSFPPSEPSYRRTRELYIGYGGCNCGGMGRMWKERSFRYGGRYAVNCSKCFRRYQRARYGRNNRKLVVKKMGALKLRVS